MSHESHLGPTCGAVTAQKKKAGVGLLLNGALSTYLHRLSTTWISSARSLGGIVSI